MKGIGLMSGTSADGIDAALLEIGPGKGFPKLHLLHFEVFPFPGGLRLRILRAADDCPGGAAELCRLNAYLGELFAKAVASVARRAGVKLREVALIGSHGQTIMHLPRLRADGNLSVRSTLQIGEPSVIAERTGVTTVADFRPRDLAAAQATGARVVIHDEGEEYHPMRFNRALGRLFQANLEALGEQVEQMPEDQELGSTDVGNVSQVVPTIQPTIALSGRPEVVCHTVAFAEAAGGPAGDRALLLAAKTLAMTALDLFADPTCLQRVRKEFDQF